MSSFEQVNKTTIQAKAFEFALFEIVRNQRESFQTLWTIDSWVKFLIWFALNCGFSGERENIEMFVNALGNHLTVRMRKIFFERSLENFSVDLLADPSEKNVFILPLSSGESISEEIIDKILFEVKLTQRVILDRETWKTHNGLITIPWKS